MNKSSRTRPTTRRAGTRSCAECGQTCRADELADDGRCPVCLDQLELFDPTVYSAVARPSGPGGWSR